jgi:hypothetical protein
MAGCSCCTGCWLPNATCMLIGRKILFLPPRSLPDPSFHTTSSRPAPGQPQQRGMPQLPTPDTALMAQLSVADLLALEGHVLGTYINADDPASFRESRQH